MLKKEASNAIDEFIMRLKYKINPQSVILFGSQSQDIQTEDSDVDLIVLSNDFLNMDDKKRLDILYEASRFITPDIHPWGFTPKEFNRIDKQSILGDSKTSGIDVFR